MFTITETITTTLIILSLLGQPIPTTFYGTSQDGYLGLHPASYWHNELPENAPQVVDWWYKGVAVNGLPFGTKLELRVVWIPKWAREAGYSDIIGNTVTVTVWDRLSRDYWLDLTPAAARELMGENWMEIGYVEVVAEIVRDVEDQDGREKFFRRTAR